MALIFFSLALAVLGLFNIIFCHFTHLPEADLLRRNSDTLATHGVVPFSVCFLRSLGFILDF